MIRQFLFVFSIVLGFCIQAQDHAFQLFGGTKNDFGVSLVERDNGLGYIIAGSTRSYGNGSSDYYVMLLNQNLQLINEFQYGGANADILKSITKINPNEYLLFGSSRDFAPGGQNYNATFIDGSGRFIDRRVIYRSATDIGYQAIKTAINEYVVVGMTERHDPYGQAKLFKLNRAGEILLEKDYGDDLVRDYAFDVIQNDSGFLMLTTKYCEIDMSAPFPVMKEPSNVNVLQVDKQGELLWEYEYKGDDYDYAYSFVEANNHLFVAMNTRSADAQSFDIKVLKLSIKGLLVDSFSFGGQGFEYANKIISDSNGDLLICGTSSSGVNRPSFYAVKFTESGSIIWEKKISANASIYANGIIERFNSNYLFTGSYNHSVDNTDAFLLELSNDGEIVYPLKNKGDNLIRVFPNPSNGRFMLNSNSIKVKAFYLYNLGAMMLYKNESIINQTSIDLDFSFLGSGLYILDVVDQENKHYQKKISIIK